MTSEEALIQQARERLVAAGLPLSGPGSALVARERSRPYDGEDWPYWNVERMNGTSFAETGHSRDAAALICFISTALPQLCDLVERLQAELSQLRTDLVRKRKNDAS